MITRRRLIPFVGVLLLPSLCWGGRILPSEQTKSALENLPTSAEKPVELDASGALTVKKEALPGGHQSNLEFGEDGQAKVPLVVPDTMIIQLEPSVTPDEINALIEERDLEVIRTFPNTGQLQVQVDLSEYFEPKLSDSSANETTIRGANEASEAFRADPRIMSATPDVFLKTQGIENLVEPSENFETTGGTETTDWGIGDIEADQLWGLSGADQGVIIGVMDAGFAPHEDIVFSGMEGNVAVSHHGNHVAGIACAEHGNDRGTRGVVPHCFVRPRVGRFFEADPGGSDVTQFYVRFGQILGTLQDFIPTRAEIKTYNISLGYNWMPNFGINPDEDGAAIYRNLVESQGAMMLAILELADAKNKVIFSAAGNDSEGLADPVDAKYASPFNWAAIEARAQGISDNGVIVEAHGKDGKRASFSNEKGHISCPGVDVLSATAASQESYGKMSGTSMASPYCAGAQALLALVRPDRSGTELVSCMTDSPAVSDSGAPRLKLSDAFQKCS